MCQLFWKDADQEMKVAAWSVTSTHYLWLHLTLTVHVIPDVKPPRFFSQQVVNWVWQERMWCRQTCFSLPAQPAHLCRSLMYHEDVITLPGSVRTMVAVWSKRGHYHLVWDQRASSPGQQLTTLLHLKGTRWRLITTTIGWKGRDNEDP